MEGGGMNYVAKQMGTYRTVVDYIHDKSYSSAKSLLTTGILFGADMLYNRQLKQVARFLCADVQMNMTTSNIFDYIGILLDKKEMRTYLD